MQSTFHLLHWVVLNTPNRHTHEPDQSQSQGSVGRSESYSGQVSFPFISHTGFRRSSSCLVSSFGLFPLPGHFWGMVKNFNPFHSPLIFTTFKIQFELSPICLPIASTLAHSRSNSCLNYFKRFLTHLPISSLTLLCCFHNKTCE